jgi:molybdenum cofactor guanylyltransferase
MVGSAISGVILAGGLARRMGGADKGLQLLDGRPLAARVAERLAPQVDELLINANRNGEAYAAFGYPVFADRVPDFAGPLAGLHAALTQARHPLVATVPCDSPFLPEDLVLRLQTALTVEDADLAVATAGGRLHPVFCLCRKTLADDLGGYLAAGERRVEAWVRRQRLAVVAFDDCPAAFGNLNTLADLARAAMPD